MQSAVLILGASSDIGLEIVNYYVDEEWRVVAHGNSSVKCLNDISELVTSFKLDMTDPKAVEAFIRENNSLFKDVSVIINCIGYIESKDYFNVNYKHMSKVFNINLFSPILFNSFLIPKMISHNWGRIVNLGSIGVKFGGGTNSFCYSMTKHSLEFMPSDHKKWATCNVLYNTVRVGVTDTKIHYKDKKKNMTDRISMIPIGRMASTQEIAKFVYWLGSNENTYITGQVLSISGGE